MLHNGETQTIGKDHALSASSSSTAATAASAANREISIAHSPDSDDAFMFYGLATCKVRVGGYKFTHVLCDIETLNQRAMSEAPNLNDALRRVKGGSELVALSIGQRLYASGCLGS
jgi:hypothetical protein